MDDGGTRRPGALARLRAAAAGGPLGNRASVAVAGVLIHHFGPAVFFPVAGIVLIVTILAGLTQREIRDFGTSPAPSPEPAA